MIPAVADYLKSLPRLGRATAHSVSVPCKICGESAPFFDVVDFNKCAAYYPFGPAGITVPYHRCDACGLLFTPFFDDWTNSDFRRFVYNEDYTIVDPDYTYRRPSEVAEHMARLLDGHQDVRILDYGAGQGVFAERMKALGFRHVESYDPFSMPTRPSGRFEVITCTEVIEHAAWPLAAFEDMQSLLTDQSCIILGETLQPPDICTVRGNWWYVAPRNGHVSTFADRTLAVVATRLQLAFHRGEGHHLMQTMQLGRFADLGRHFGDAMVSFRLGAPRDAAADGFHGVEGKPGERFRWTASDTIGWHVTVPAGRPRLVQVMVPYMHESKAGFAAACTLDVGGHVASTSVRESAIFAEVAGISPGAVAVTLRTPELRSSPNDARQLGLGIAVTHAT